jgi:putative spermidine/putrescine transport system substrate-binding protein
MKIVKWMGAIALAAATMLAVDSAMAADKLAGTTLRVATWGGSWRDAIHKYIGSELEKRGVKVEYVIGNPEDSIAKLIAARGRDAPFDVMEGQPIFNDMLIKEGLIQKLNYDNIPNAKDFPSWAVAPYHVVELASQNGLVYNTEKFKEHGIAPLERYSDLTNPKLRGHVAFPDAAVSQVWQPAVMLAYEAGGSEKSMQGAIDYVNKIKPLYFYRASTELSTKFALGDVWVAPWHAGWAVRMKRKGLPIGFSHPRVGTKRGTITESSVQIVANTPNLAGAEAFINIYLSGDALAAFTRQTGMAPMGSTARKALMSDATLSEVLILSDEGIDNLFLVDWASLDQKAFRDLWNRKIDR